MATLTTPTMEERMSRMEGAYEHLATKADLAEMETRVTKWVVGLMALSAIAAVTSTISILVQLLIKSGG